MTCYEVREHMFAFLDNELDATLSIDLQRHLDHCPQCAREAEIERTIGKRLIRAVAAVGGDFIPSFDETWSDAQSGRQGLPDPVGREYTRRAERSAAGPRSLRARWGRVVAVAATLFLVVGLPGWLVIRSHRASRAQATLADLMVRDFTHFVEEGAPLSIRSSDPEAVSRWLAEKTGVPVRLAVAGAPYRLLGGRKCKVQGRPAAFAAYEIDGSLASIVALLARDAELAGLGPLPRSVAPPQASQHGGYTVVAQCKDELLYAVVSTRPADELIQLLAGILHEDD